jgi:hypothetical protein
VHIPTYAWLALSSASLAACGSETRVNPASSPPTNAVTSTAGSGGAGGAGGTSGDGGAGGTGVKGQIGDACDGVEDCTHTPGSAVCLTTLGIPPAAFTWPGGYCSSLCSLTEAGSCGSQAVCIAYPGYPGLCAKTCSSNASCRTAEGYACVKVPAVPFAMCGAPLSLPFP